MGDTLIEVIDIASAAHTKLEDIFLNSQVSLSLELPERSVVVLYNLV